MKRFVPLILLTLGAGIAQAQTTTPAPAPAAPAATTPPAATTAPAAAATPPAATPKKPLRHHRMTLAERFGKANTTNDGKLTADQAKAAGFTYVTRHFDAIDTGKKGYVTIDDIHAYSKAQHTTHHTHAAAKPPAAPATTN